MIYSNYFISYIYNEKKDKTLEDGLKLYHNKLRDKQLIEPEKDMTPLFESIYDLNIDDYKKLFTIFYKGKVDFSFVVENSERCIKAIKENDFEYIGRIYEVKKRFLSVANNIVRDDFYKLDDNEKLLKCNRLLDSMCEDSSENIIANSIDTLEERCNDLITDNKTLDFFDNLLKQFPKMLLDMIKRECVRIKAHQEVEIENKINTIVVESILRTKKRKNYGFNNIKEGFYK